MKKSIIPVVLASVLTVAGASALKTARDRREDRSQSAVLQGRLARAEAVSAAVTKIDALYLEVKDENAVLRRRLASAEAASRRCPAEWKDAVAQPAPDRSPLPLPGYGR